MKKFVKLMVMLAVALTTGLATAQEAAPVGMGVKLGLSMYSFGGADRDIEKEGPPEVRYGFGVGGYLTFGLGPELSLQPEVLFVTKGAKFGTDEDGYQINFAYLEVPVLLKYRFSTTGNPRPNLYAGPVGSINLSADARMQEDGIETEYDFSDYVKGFDFGLATGGGLDFVMAGNTITFDVRYTFGLTEWPVAVEKSSVKNSGWLALVGVEF